MTTSEEIPIVFRHEECELVGVLHSSAAGENKRGVVIVVGGPQYRVGSHRQFVLLARRLAEAGNPVLRFDYRGMGDSSGPKISFEQTAGDIRAAVEVLFARLPGLQEAVLLGLCDAASASMLHCHVDKRISGLILLNPWARTETGEARAVLRHYYLRRLVQGSFWRKLLSGGLDPRRIVTGLAEKLRIAGRASPDRSQRPHDGEPPHYTIRMREQLARFRGRALLVICGNDLTAAEFVDMTRGSRVWSDILGRGTTEMRHLAGANHTFSRVQWRDQVAAWCVEWLRSW